MSTGLATSMCDRAFSDERHGQIVGRLEEAKSRGLITDFFVSWVGTDGNLNPVVRVWRDPEIPENRIRDYISTSLAGTISPSDLTIVDEEWHDHVGPAMTAAPLQTLPDRIAIATRLADVPDAN